jgi:type I restriction enzyme S subunit
MEAVFDVAGGIQKTPLRDPKDHAFPYLGVGNVHRGRIDLTTVKMFELQEGELERRRLEPGDLLIIEGNGSLSEIGRCAQWNGEIKDCVHQNHVIRCRPLDAAISAFVLCFMNSASGVQIMQRLAITTSGLYSLSVGKIRQITVPVPPLAEQHRIVAKVNELIGLCDRLEWQLTTAQEERRHLLEAILHETQCDQMASHDLPGRL